MLILNVSLNCKLKWIDTIKMHVKQIKGSYVRIYKGRIELNWYNKMHVQKLKLKRLIYII